MPRGKRYAVVLAALFVVLTALPSFGSSHREAPLTAGDPQIDATDVYAFVSPDAPNSVTLLSTWIPFETPSGGPNFYPWAAGVRYDINIDNNGDAKPDLIYRWVFTDHYRNPKTFLMNTGPVASLTDKNLNFYQTYTLNEITVATGSSKTLVADGIAAPSNVGAASMPDYGALSSQAVTSLKGETGSAWVGQSDDPFFLDLRVFDLLYGANLKEAGHDTLSGFNVNGFALQIPKTALAEGHDAAKSPIIGIWTTAERQSIRTQSDKGAATLSGPFVQVSRLGNPLVNEVVAPVGAKNLFNSSKPIDDAQFLPAVLDPEVPKLIEAIYKIKAPAAPRKDLVSVFLTGVKGLTMPAKVTPSEELRLNMSIAPAATPNRLGVIGGDTAGYPNGRRLTDDVIDIDLRVLEGELLGTKTGLGDGVDANDVPFRTTFPYLALPHSGSLAGAEAGAAAAPAAAAATAGKAATKNRGLSGLAITMIAIGAAILGMILASMMRRKPTPAAPARGMDEEKRRSA